MIAPAGRIFLAVHTGDVTQPPAASRSCGSCRNPSRTAWSHTDLINPFPRVKFHQKSDFRLISAQAGSWGTDGDGGWCWWSFLFSLSQNSAVIIWCFATLSLTRAVFKTLEFSLEKLRLNSSQNGSNLHQKGISERRLALGFPSQGTFTCLQTSNH